MQQKNVKNKLSWTQRKRDIETKIYHIRYNWKSILVKITILLFESIAILIFNFNLVNISWLNKVNSKFQILALNKLVGFEVNFIYYLVYVLTLVPIVITIRLLFKPVNYTEYDEKMELVFKPENKEENKNLIPPTFIVKYPNKEDDTTIYMFYKNSFTKEEIDTKWETIRNHFSLYVKDTEDYDTDKILIYLSKNNPLYPKTITFNDKCLSDLLKANNDNKNNPLHDLMIILGKNGAGKYQWWNLSRNVMGKITGATRMGKTKMQKCICAEFLLLNTGGAGGVGGNRLYVYDGKGIDYQGIWKELYNCTILNTEQGLLNTLIILDYEYERRKIKLVEKEIDTIDNYNLEQEESDKIPHIMLVIEEAADIFDKDFSTYPKETKEQKDALEREKLIHAKIIYYIEQLIRKGGATAIHVILNSQKLTRTNLPKSVPTNINENWSAYVDSVTSEIVVGNTDANELLNKDAKGMFVNDNHEVIQGFLIDEDYYLYKLKSGHKIDGDLKVARYVEDIENMKNREINFY